MSDLKVFKIPLGNITLEKLDSLNNSHIMAVETMRDKKAVEMCYDIQTDIALEKNDTLLGTSFLVRRDNQYVGYMYISDDFEGERILAYIVEKTVRGKGLGKIMLTSVSNYLFDCCGTTTLKLYINRNNDPGICLASKCGFEKTSVTDGTLCEFDKKR